MIQTYIRQSDFAISQRFYFHKTSHTYAKFRENKALGKISEFTVTFISLAYRKACRRKRMSPFQGSVACKRRFEFYLVAYWPRG